MRHLTHSLLGAALAVLATFGTPAGAKDPAVPSLPAAVPAGTMSAQADPAAVAVLEQLGKAFRGKAFSVDYTLTIQQSADMRTTMSHRLLSAPPNRLSIRNQNGPLSDQAPRLVADGKTITTVFPPDLVVRTTQTATLQTSQIDPIINNIMFAGVGAEVLLALTQPEPGTALCDAMSSLTLSGEEDLHGVRAHRLRTVLTMKVPVPGPQGEIQMPTELWISTGKEPRLLRLQPDMQGLMKQAGGASPMPDLTMRLDFDAWNLEPKVADDAFSPDVPAGAKQYASLMEGFQAMQEQRSAAASEDNGPEAALKGKPAPDFTLALAGGGKLHLAEKKGKVVMLDFWATWCPPCRASLPTLADVAKKYAARGLEFYAVNLREEEQVAADYVKGEKLAIQVALDSKGETADLYGVQGIPTTVIVDTQGTVAYVHVGGSPDLETELSAVLDKLLAGQ